MTLQAWWKLCEIARTSSWSFDTDVCYASIAGKASAVTIGITGTMLAELQHHPKFPFFRRDDFTGSDRSMLDDIGVHGLAITPFGPVFATQQWMRDH